VNLYRKARKNAGVRRVAIILLVTGVNRKIDEMPHLVFTSVVKCLRLQRGEVADSTCSRSRRLCLSLLKEKALCASIALCSGRNEGALRRNGDESDEIYC
jgi:hypothetical protein